MINNANSSKMDTKTFQEHVENQELKLLGQGKYSKVYKVEIGSKNYALKQFQRESTSLNYLDNVLNEVRILSKTQNQNLLRMLGKYRTKENYFIILEYCNGGDLKNFIKNYGPLNEIMARKIIKQLVKALCYMHQDKQIIHRDIKSQNILIQWKFDPSNFTNMTQFAQAFDLHSNCIKIKLADFGFARFLSPFEVMNQSFGTPIYMAPEVLQGKCYDFKADIWSLGVTFFEMLTGKYPFYGQNRSEILQSIITGNYQIQQQYKLSPYCLDFLNRCLQFKADQRDSAGELLNHPFLKLKYHKQRTLIKTDPFSSNLLSSYKTEPVTQDTMMTCIKTQKVLKLDIPKNNSRSESDIQQQSQIQAAQSLSNRRQSFDSDIINKESSRQIQINGLLNLKTPRSIFHLDHICHFSNNQISDSRNSGTLTKLDFTFNEHNEQIASLHGLGQVWDGPNNSKFENYKKQKNEQMKMNKEMLDSIVLDPENNDPLNDYFHNFQNQKHQSTRTTQVNSLQNIESLFVDAEDCNSSFEIDPKQEAILNFKIPQLIVHRINSLN